MTIKTGLLFPVPQHSGTWVEDGEDGAGWMELDGASKVAFAFKSPDGGRTVVVQPDFEKGNVQIWATDEPVSVALVGGPEGPALMRAHNVVTLGVKPGATETTPANGSPVG